ncbi:hypothetical protein [Chryseobacterium gossypii]|uniref:hypothetical protein n=1 Tax=Chryseobacterium gossypii TaxID=3231602 RepID=UPI003525C324
MSNILAGLFAHHSDYKKLEADLESLGFESSDYIVYLDNNHTDSQYMASVAVTDHSQIDNAKDVFRQNAALKTYLFENMNIEQANYNTIRKFIDARNRAEIHNCPDVKIRAATNGIDSEVKF